MGKQPGAIIVCFLTALGVQASAIARPTLTFTPTTTMREVLDACGADDEAMRAESCDYIFTGLMTVARMQAAAPPNLQHPLCFDRFQSLDEFRSRMLTWTRNHPEVHEESAMHEGSFHAFGGAYRCD
jgi:hypothetical protein